MSTWPKMMALMKETSEIIRIINEVPAVDSEEAEVTIPWQVHLPERTITKERKKVLNLQ